MVQNKYVKDRPAIRPVYFHFVSQGETSESEQKIRTSNFEKPSACHTQSWSTMTFSLLGSNNLSFSVDSRSNTGCSPPPMACRIKTLLFYCQKQQGKAWGWGMGKAKNDMLIWYCQYPLLLNSGLHGSVGPSPCHWVNAGCHLKDTDQSVCTANITKTA